MKKYYIITFLCRQDAIVLQDILNEYAVKSYLQSSPYCVKSKCSYVVRIDNENYSAINILEKHKNLYKNIYLIIEDKMRKSCILVE